MRIAYGDDVYDEGIAGMDDAELVEAAGNVTRGVPIATPVFDGAKEADVNDSLAAGWVRHLGSVDLVRWPHG